MAKISINLLPPEITELEVKRTRFYKVQFIGIVIILTMVFLSSLVFALRILQSHNISAIQVKVAAAEQQVSDLRGTETSLVLLKNRLSTIDKFLGVSSKQSLMFGLLDKLMPAGVVVNSVVVDRSGGATLLVLAPDTASLDTLLNNLTSKETNEGSISEISVETINRGRDNYYRVSFKVKAT